MWSHCAAVYDFLNYFKLILRHRYYHKTPLTQTCDNFKGHTGFKSVHCVEGLQTRSRHINAFYLMYSLRESVGAAARRKVNKPQSACDGKQTAAEKCGNKIIRFEKGKALACD